MVLVAVEQEGGVCVNRLQDEAELEYYRARLRELWPHEGRLSPVPNPVSLERAHLDALRSTAYAVALKADGTRYLLMLTVDADGEAIALLIDRRLQMFEISVWGPPVFFERGTVLDGELVESSRSRSTYMVFDAVVSAGVSVAQRAYDARMMEARAIVAAAQDGESQDHLAERIGRDHCVAAAGNPVDLAFSVKQHVPLSQIGTLWAQRRASAFHFDGIVFTPTEQPVHVGTHPSMFKWKAVHTVDVLVEKLPGGDYTVCVGVPPHFVHGDRDTLRFRGADWRLRLVANVVTGSVAGETWKHVVECTCDMNSAASVLYFTPLKMRADKEFGNGIATTKGTLSTILEGIQIAELLRLAQ